MSGLPKPSSIADIEAVAKHANKIAGELRTLYEASLLAQNVSSEARIATHDVIEKCCNAFDQLMYAGWYKRIYPKLAKPPKRGGYYPAAESEASYRSTLGQWGCSDLDAVDPDMDRDLKALQPFVDPSYQWIADLRRISPAKHTGLIPQTRIEQHRVTVSGPNGGISWDPTAVRFGSSVSVNGAPIDPRTQMPVATPGVTVNKQVWVSFQIEGTGLDALSFCEISARKTLEVIATLKKSWSLD